VNQFIRNNTAALHIAAELGSLQVLKALLAFPGLNLENVDGNGNTAYLSAAKAGRVNVISILKDAGAQTNVSNTDGYNAATFAAAAGNFNLLTYLCDNNLISDDELVNTRDRHGQTLLHHAARAGSTTVLHLLLGRGVDRMVTASSTGQLPLHIASSLGHVAAAFMLLGTVAECDAEAVRLTNVATAAAEDARAVLVAERQGRIDAKAAAAAAKAEAAAAAAAEAGEAGEEGGEAAPAEPEAAQEAEPEAEQEEEEEAEIPPVEVTPFEPAGFGVNAQDAQGETSLHAAAGAGHVPMCELLLKRGASLLKMDRRRFTACEEAASSNQGDCLQLLLPVYEKEVAALPVPEEAPVEGEENSGKAEGVEEKTAAPPLSGEAMRTQCLLLGVEADAVDVVAVLLESGGVDLQAGKGEEAVQVATDASSLRSLELLLAKGASVTALNAQEQTALQSVVTAEVEPEQQQQQQSSSSSSLVAQLIQLLVAQPEGVNAATLAALIEKEQFHAFGLVLTALSAEVAPTLLAEVLTLVLPRLLDHWESWGQKILEQMVSKGLVLSSVTYQSDPILFTVCKNYSPSIANSFLAFYYQCVQLQKAASSGGEEGNDNGQHASPAALAPSPIPSGLDLRNVVYLAVSNKDKLLAQGGTEEVPMPLDDINAVDAEGVTLLHWAIQQQKWDLVQELVAVHGADCNIKLQVTLPTDEDVQAQQALMKDEDWSEEKVAEYQVKEEAKTWYRAAQRAGYNATQFLAAQGPQAPEVLPLFEIFRERGAEMEVLSSEEQPLLEIARSSGTYQVIHLLIEPEIQAQIEEARRILQEEAEAARIKAEAEAAAAAEREEKAAEREAARAAALAAGEDFPEEEEEEDSAGGGGDGEEDATGEAAEAEAPAEKPEVAILARFPTAEKSLQYPHSSGVLVAWLSVALRSIRTYQSPPLAMEALRMIQSQVDINVDCRRAVLASDDLPLLLDACVEVCRLPKAENEPWQVTLQCVATLVRSCLSSQPLGEGSIWEGAVALSMELLSLCLNDMPGYLTEAVLLWLTVSRGAPRMAAAAPDYPALFTRVAALTTNASATGDFGEAHDDSTQRDEVPGVRAAALLLLAQDYEKVPLATEANLTCLDPSAVEAMCEDMCVIPVKESAPVSSADKLDCGFTYLYAQESMDALQQFHASTLPASHSEEKAKGDGEGDGEGETTEDASASAAALSEEAIEGLMKHAQHLFGLHATGHVALRMAGAGAWIAALLALPQITVEQSRILVAGSYSMCAHCPQEVTGLTDRRGTPQWSSHPSTETPHFLAVELVQAAKSWDLVAAVMMLVAVSNWQEEWSEEKQVQLMAALSRRWRMSLNDGGSNGGSSGGGGDLSEGIQHTLGSMLSEIKASLSSPACVQVLLTEGLIPTLSAAATFLVTPQESIMLLLAALLQKARSIGVKWRNLAVEAAVDNAALHQACTLLMATPPGAGEAATPRSREDALGAGRLLAEVCHTREGARAVVEQAGGVEALLAGVKASYSPVQLASLQALASLSAANGEARERIWEEGGCEQLLAICVEGNKESCTHAGAALGNVAAHVVKCRKWLKKHELASYAASCCLQLAKDDKDRMVGRRLLSLASV
jgi:ankyrin repeat protein